jgi:hypothetical protein
LPVLRFSENPEQGVIASVNDTGNTFIASVVENGPQFIADVFDTGEQPTVPNIFANFWKKIKKKTSRVREYSS